MTNLSRKIAPHFQFQGPLECHFCGRRDLPFAEKSAPLSCCLCIRIPKDGVFYGEPERRTITPDEFERYSKTLENFQAAYPARVWTELQWQLTQMVKKMNARPPVPGITALTLDAQCGKKLTAAFRQRSLLKERAGMALLKSLKVVGCVPLSLSWIDTHRANPATAPGDRVKAFNSDASFVAHNAVARKYNQNKNCPEKKIEAFMESPKEGRHLREKDVETFANSEGLSDQPGHYFILMKIKDSPTDHACAMYVGEADTLFFDSNFGEFKVGNQERSGFLREIQSLYLNWVEADGTASPKKITEWLFSFMDGKAEETQPRRDATPKERSISPVGASAARG